MATAMLTTMATTLALATAQPHSPLADAQQDLEAIVVFHADAADGCSQQRLLHSGNVDWLPPQSEAGFQVWLVHAGVAVHARIWRGVRRNVARGVQRVCRE